MHRKSTLHCKCSVFFFLRRKNPEYKSEIVYAVESLQNYCIYKYICKRAKMYMCVCAVQGTYIQLNRDHINGDAPVTAK